MFYLLVKQKDVKNLKYNFDLNNYFYLKTQNYEKLT